MSKKILALVLLLALSLPSFAALKGLESTKEEGIVKVGENIVVPEGAEIKAAVAVGGNVEVLGTVKEDVVAVGGNVVLQKSAVVGGNAVSVGGKVDKMAGAKVVGEITEIKFPAAMITKGFGWGLAILSILSFIAFVVLAVILVALFSKQLGITSYYVEKLPGHALLWGLLIAILTPLIIVMLVLSVIGIVFIPLYLLLLWAAGVFGYVAVSQLIGKKVLKALRIYNRPMMWEMIVGLILLCLIGFLPVLGWIAKGLAALMGLGAILATRFGTQA